MLFKKKPKVIDFGGQKIELEPKPNKFSFFKKKPKVQAPSFPGMQAPQAGADMTATAETPQPQAAPAMPPVYGAPQQGAQPQPQQQPRKGMMFGFGGKPKPAQTPFGGATGAGAMPQGAAASPPMPRGVGKPARPINLKPSKFKLYVEGIGAKQKGLETALRDQGIKESLYSFVKRMIISSVLVGAVVGITLAVLFSHLGLNPIESVLLGAVLGFAVFRSALTSFLRFPTAKKSRSGKLIERDILFASRDLIISLRSGMPLFNAITSVSRGYGEASQEFERIVNRVQLGMPLEEALDATVAESKSPSFRRIMLQASTSIKAGADVVEGLQSIIDQLSQERVIELRRYGQRLNALAMFYMLFGIILPSMGIAVVTILTTFIALFAVTQSLLIMVLVALLFMQVIFLKLITASRPIFTM